MKKGIKAIIILIVIVVIINISRKILLKEYDLSYKINGYKIEEYFSTNNHHNYDFIISKGKNIYIFSYEKNLNKSKKIIKEIKTYKSNNLKCIKVKLKDEYNNILCNLDNSQISTDYLLKNNNVDFQAIIQNNKLKIDKKVEDNQTTKYKKINIYKNNINDKEKYIIWNYKGIIIFSKDNNAYKKILNYDLYDNIMSTIVGDYFVLFENTKVSGIENIYYYNLKKDKLMTFKLKDKISKDSYINGIVNNQIIVTDRKNKKQYQINVAKKRIEEIDNNQTSYITYINNQKKELSISDFFMKDQLFEITNNNYNYYYEDNKFYKVINNSKNNPILLTEVVNCDQWFIKDNEIFIISDGQLLSYTDEFGLVKILEYNELKYNYDNIIRIWKE